MELASCYVQCACAHDRTNVSKFSLCKKIRGKKNFANGMHWRNWQKFSPGENFCVYGTILRCVMEEGVASCRDRGREREKERVHSLTCAQCLL